MNGMTTNRDPETVMDAWLDEGPTDLPDATRRAILAALPTTQQARRGPFAPWRLHSMNGSARIALGAAAIVIVAVGGIYLLGGLRPTGSVGGPGPSPSPTATSNVNGGTITLTSSGCTWTGNPGSLDLTADRIHASVSIVNQTDTFANFGIYRLDAGYAWADAAAWVAAENAALRGGASHPPEQDFAAPVGSIDEPQRGEHGETIELNGGTYGVVCSSNEPPPGLVFAVYLVGPLEVTDLP
jgi:hypothetical protein